MANIDKITLRGVNYPIVDSSIPSYVRGITQTDITNWNNKLDTFTETDPTIPSYVRGITQQNITDWNNKLSSYTETDPTVPSHVKSITQQNITDWNNKLDSHQDLSSYVSKTELNAAGYLTSYTETDPTVPSYVKEITQDDITYWDNKEDRTVSYLTYYETSTPVTVGDTHDEAISKIVKIINDNEYVTAAAITDLAESMPDMTAYVSKTELSAAGYLQSFTETDPTVPSYVKGITQSDITNWNNKTSNTGTITGINMNGTSKGTSGVVDLGTVVTSESDPTVASYIKNITQTDISNWNSKTSNVGTITGINMNGASKGTNGVVDLGTVITSESDPIFVSSAAYGIQSSDITNWNAKLDSSSLNNYYTKTEINSAGYLQSHQSLTSYANSAYYDSGARKIYLRHDSTTLSTIDANDFIKDGMVETAYVQGGNLVISFNTDAGKQPVTIPITDIFNASNYYTKTEINNASYVTATQLNNAGYLQSFTESDPVFSASAAAGIQASDISNWNSKTSNTGTITGINMNGASKGTSGVVDLGTVVTSESDPTVPSYVKGITQSDISNWNSKTDNVGTITGITMNGASKGTSGVVDLGTVITSYTETDPTVPSHVKSITQQNITDWGNKLDSSALNNYYTKSEINSAAYLQSESDPIYSASAAAGITSSDISNWNNKTNNTGTVTGVKMNGETKGTAGIVDLGTVVTQETDPTVASYIKSITQSDITNWNSKTNNTGTITGITMNGVNKGTAGVVDLGTVITSETQLSKGSTSGSGNAVTDISVSNHQITLTKGKTFIETETDPVYSASAAAGITSSDISNWNSKTSNTGTITGINMNGASKGTSGVVDLGTVITSETQLSKGTTTGSGNAVTDISVSNHQITLTKGSTFLTSETDPIYSASAAAGITSGMITNWNSYANVKANWNETNSNSAAYIQNKPTIPAGLPSVTSSDNGKILQVVNGVWTLVSPVTLYSGSGTPNNAQGNNGDIYLQI